MEPMNTIRALLIDDEPDSIRLMQLMLKEHFPGIAIAGAFTSSARALEQWSILQPDLVFLDIEMPVMNGFELLEALPQLNCAVVFVTAYNEFAIKAFRFNALDYLVKPVALEDLATVIEKATRQQALKTDQLQLLRQQLKKGQITKIAVPGQTGIVFVDLRDILYVEASGNYACLVLPDNRKLLISKTLKDIQEVLEEQQFLRIHRQYIINLNQVKHFNRNESLLTMINNEVLPVSRNQKENLISQYGWL